MKLVDSTLTHKMGVLRLSVIVKGWIPFGYDDNGLHGYLAKQLNNIMIIRSSIRNETFK